MRMTHAITATAAGLALAIGVVGGSGAATDAEPPRTAWVAPAGTPAEAAARTAVAAARGSGAEAEARFPRDRFERDTAVRYLRARGFEVRLLGTAAR